MKEEEVMSDKKVPDVAEGTADCSAVEVKSHWRSGNQVPGQEPDGPSSWTLTLPKEMAELGAE